MREQIAELISDCATRLPPDVESALAAARRRERGQAAAVLGTMLENARLARVKGAPMCQDTGTLIFYVTAPAKADRERIRFQIAAAVAEATKSVPLRCNAVDPVGGANLGGNAPVIHFSEGKGKKANVELMLKGGGSENVTQLYGLPDSGLNAGRDLDGVRRCVLDAVHKAQGKGCPPYIIGVGIGGLPDQAIALAKKQLIRRLGDRSRDAKLAALERRLLIEINSLGIGPMGLGGKTTALAVKAGAQQRHPASYFVAVSFMCWACRRGAVEVRL
jgi:fumarate hydratase class I